MALRQSKRISELESLSSASLQTTLVGVDNGTTYKVTLDVLEDAIINMVSRSTDLRLDSLEAYTASVSASSIPLGTISSSTQISAFGFISSSHTDITSLNSFTSSQNTLNSAFTSGINARLQTSSFNDFSTSVDSRIIAATNEQSFNGLVSGSSQLTSSYDERYVLSGSITQTTWDNIANKPSGIVSQSTDLSSLNTFTQSVDNRVDSLESWSSSLTDTFATDLEVSIVSSSVAATIGIISQNTGLVSTSSFNSYTASITTASLVTSITNLNSFTTSQYISNSYFATTGSNLFVGTQTISGSIIPAVNGSYDLGSVDNPWRHIYVNTGSIFLVKDARIVKVLNTDTIVTTTDIASGSVNISPTLPTGVISGSLQITSLGFISSSQTVNTGSLVTTSSFNSYTASISTGSLVTSISNLNSATSSYLTSLSGAISSSSQLTSSFDTRYATSGSVGSSVNTSSLATTGSNSFNGNQTITGSLIVSAVAVVNGGVTIPTGSTITLTSGSSISVDASGAITGSLTGSVFGIGDVVAFSSSVNSRLNNAGGVAGTISSSAQITAFGFVSGSYETTGRSIVSGSSQIVSLLPTGVISGSSQLTSSYDTRYTLSGSVSAVPSGTISGSSQITAFGFVSSSATIPVGTISGSAQITAFGFVSSSTSVPAGTISGSSQLTSSFDGRYVQTGSFNTLTASFNSFTASAQSVTTGSNSFNGTQTITGSLIITTGSFVASQILANTASLYLTSGSNLYVQNNGVVEITGSLIVSGSTTLKVPVLYVGTGSSVEGGEIDLAYAQSGSTTLTGSAVVFDIWQDRVRIFENGGTNRGGYFDISTLGAGVGTDLGKLTYFIEAYANVSYTLPGSYTNDVCRYSVVSANLNVPTSWFNTSTYTFTPLRAGYWEIIASYDVYRNGEASLIIQKNGTSVAGAGAISSVVQQVTKIIYLNGSTDYINVYNAGVNANARTQTSSNAFFQARFVGA
jgi:hypothetical protein